MLAFRAVDVVNLVKGKHRDPQIQTQINEFSKRKGERERDLEALSCSSSP